MKKNARQSRSTPPAARGKPAVQSRGTGGNSSKTSSGSGPASATPRKKRVLPEGKTTAPVAPAVRVAPVNQVAAKQKPARAPARGTTDDFPVVGIGASAGGLEALESFFSSVSEQSGVAFVIVQHLDPTHKAMIAELLQHSTSLPVVEIVDGVRLRPDHVYIIPPNKDVSLINGTLKLSAPAAPRGLRLPINFFFQSLATDRLGKSIGVVLSGMGTDGTIGLRAIKQRGGATFVQLPASAKFDSMPRSAIDAGLADVVAAVGELPGKIVAYVRKTYPARAAWVKQVAGAGTGTHEATGAATAAEPHIHGQLETVLTVLRMCTGHDFSSYKASTLLRRIDRRMNVAQLGTIGEYIRYLRDNPAECELLFKELLIGVTSFFRDPAVWAQLRDEVLPALIKARLFGVTDTLTDSPGDPVATPATSKAAGGRQGGHLTLRAWVPGCSTGEEAYSLAMVFQEVIDRLKPTRSVTLQIFATDLDQDAIDKARAAVYPANIAGDVGQERLRRFFAADQSKYRINSEIREMVIFAQQNLVMDPPFTKLDLLSCRNLLIYLEPELQRTLIPLFHYSLKPGGVLMLGTAETVGTATDLFGAVSGKNRLYRRLDTPMKVQSLDFPTVFTRKPASAVQSAPEALPGKAAGRPVSVQDIAEKLLLAKYCPVGVLVTEQGDIVYISGKAGKYLEPAAGKVNWNLLAMARGRLAYELIEAFPQAVRKKALVKLRGVDIGEKDSKHAVDITIQPLEEPEAVRGMAMVVFSDALPVPGIKDAGTRAGAAQVPQVRLAAMARQLQHARDELRTVREEMLASQEDLKSANEELQSTNEEAQSSNEELTTSKEEMQSMNEELQTVNHELQAKVDELSRASNDMNNLLNSTDIATLFLDATLHVRRFTNKISSIIKLIATDAGRMITDIVTTLDYPQLAEDARQVLRTLMFTEKQISDKEGRWFTVRIMPYRTHDNKIDGVVITFSDISVAKKLEAELRAAKARLRTQLTDQTAELGQANKDLKAEIEHRQEAELSADAPRSKDGGKAGGKDAGRQGPARDSMNGKPRKGKGK